ncbi:uncharacterized protein F4822DRAFT_403871 [Hypoxylon trugodes]|uniref:uncharacterized protein n=1 Tax=Hypoxylon trugodes TaxID=326681 RepID=UPI002199EDE6|nr:uncharacterized protein F4822DRAFT_403871 [Hypoxylon trugodes]KAI1388775.1 hypothetical protein F4822DRAFT_403871 [Hypoxylon trugodes]
MASDTSSRPPTENGGSRPPTSRFVEGSMNDRVSATPPPQFLGPEQLKAFEKQFYKDYPYTSQQPQETRGKRRERPFSESIVTQQTGNPQDHIITHRKSTSFFNRVRDALGWNLSSRSNGGGKQDVSKKHSSLQEPPLSPRSDHLRAAKSHSEMYNLPQLSNLGVNGTGPGAIRPSREDVLQSYNELMATGFFQSHAIQSTRHAGPAGHSNDRRAAPPMPPPMPSIPGSAPCSPQPPPRVSSMDAATSGPNSPLSPTKAGHRVRKVEKSESEPEAEEMPVLMPVTNDKISREARFGSLRGRKRNRTDTEDASANVEATAPGASTSSSFAQPLKRVAKKLRKMPSSNRDSQIADGVVGLPPSTSVGGTVYLKERAVRMRSPSPPAPAPEVSTRRPERRRRRPEFPNQNQEHQQLPSRRTFSTSSRVGEGGKLRKRGKSASLRSRSASGGGGLDPWEMDSERGSMDGIHQDATATTGPSDPAPARSREVTPLSVVPDANRGIPSVPRIPDQYHYHKPRIQPRQKRRYNENIYVYDDQNENAQAAEGHFGEAL